MEDNLPDRLGIIAPPTDVDLLHALSAMGGTVLAVGDIMLDVFTYGAAARISPEAPVPIVRTIRETRMLGGVGNVARNVAALGGRTILVAPTGADERATIIDALVAAEPSIEGALLRCETRRTTMKTRIIAAGQQMLRVDEEDVGRLSGDDERSMIAAILRAIPSVDVIVLSDYAKGALTPELVRRTIEAAHAAGKIVLVDPKHRGTQRYRGADWITPNAGELATATGLATETDEGIEAAARVMLGEAEAEFVLATRSDKGMSLVSKDAGALHLPARKREVFDVSGAGDTVIAVLALASAGGIAAPLAAGLANTAAGVVVGKQGTATCSRDELELALSDSMLGLGAKLQGLARAARLVEHWRGRGQRIGFTNGCFDLLHPGHVTLLQRARDCCDRLIVGLNSDASVARLKGPERPLQNQAARAAVLAALACVDLVVIFDEDTPLDLIGALKPSVLLKGADYALDQVVGANLVRSYGGEVRLVELVAGQSTTGIIARMR